MPAVKPPDANMMRMIIDHERTITDLEKQLYRLQERIITVEGMTNRINDLVQLVQEANNRQLELLDMILFLRERGEKLQERIFDLEHKTHE